MKPPVRCLVGDFVDGERASEFANHANHANFAFTVLSQMSHSKETREKLRGNEGGSMRMIATPIGDLMSTWR